jgi:hypothetical protein
MQMLIEVGLVDLVGTGWVRQNSPLCLEHMFYILKAGIILVSELVFLDLQEMGVQCQPKWV